MPDALEVDVTDDAKAPERHRDGTKAALIADSERKKEGKKERKKEGNSRYKGNTEANSEPPEPNTTVSDNLIQHAEAKRLFGKLSARVFGKELPENQWSSLMEHQLDAASPLKRKDWELIDWAYGLPEGHEVFNFISRRQSIEALIENLSREVQKIRSIRERLGLDSPHDKTSAPASDGWTPERRAATEKLFPGCDPGPFYLLDQEIQRQIEEKVKEERDRLPPDS